MSVLIKGMERPENCSVCPLLQDNSDVYTPFYCPLVQEVFDCDSVLKQNGRPENCPIVDVPTPHGRLIDADEMIDAINQSKFTYKVSPEFVDNRTDEEKRSSLFQLIKCTMVQVVEAMPSIEPEQKTGTWEVQPSGELEADFIWWKCSNCGQVIFSSSETDRRTFHAYCGRCGSKMY